MKINTNETGTGSLPAVINVISEVLQVRDLEPDTDFFDVGGTSLAAMQIVWKLEQELGVTVTLTNFFDAVDLQAVADLIDAKVRDGDVSGGRDEPDQAR